MKKNIDWAILVFGAVGLVLLLLKAIMGWTSLGPIPLDANYIAIGLMVMYTLLTGIKLWLSANRQLGLYMIFFSVLIIFLAAIGIRWQFLG